VTLGLVNATNARDLGGVQTSDGRHVRTGVLFRANALNRLADADVAVLGSLGLGCVVDLRSALEVEVAGPDRLPEPPPRLVALPLADPDNEVFATVTRMIWAGPTAEVLAQASLDASVLVEEMRRSYVWLATSATARAAYGAALRLVASEDALPLLFHCTAGKDRTGWLAAVLLTALGVDDEQVMRDYLRTAELTRELTEFAVGRLRGQVADPAAVLPMLEARPEYLRAGFAAVAQEYGTFDDYLRDGLGLSDGELTALRTNLLEHSP
jgi:protein-tyrosine phosphatase